MIADTITHLRENGQRVFLDAEHFFDGYKSNPRVRAAKWSERPWTRALPWSPSATPTAA